MSAVLLLTTGSHAQGQEPRAARRVGEQAVPFDGGFGYPVYPLSDNRLCPGGATHTYSYTREFSIAGDMVFTCKVNAQNKNITEVVVYDKEFRLAFRDAAGASRLGRARLGEPQFSQTRRVLYARDGMRVYELDPWNRRNRVVVGFGGVDFELPEGRKVRAGVARSMKVGPGDTILVELGIERRMLNPGARDCLRCFEILGVAVYDPATGKIHADQTRNDGRVAAWPKIGSRGFDESNLTQDSPPRVFHTYDKRPSWSFALDFSDAIEFRHPSFGPYGNEKRQWSAHGHMGFFCGSNGRCYVVKVLNDITDADGDGVPDRVGQVGTAVEKRWRPLFVLANTATGRIELVWGTENLERSFSRGHFSRSLARDVFFGSGNTVTRYTVEYDSAGNPTAVAGENVAYTNSNGKCGYWAQPRATSSDDGARALFDSTLAGGCDSHVYAIDTTRRIPASK